MGWRMLRKENTSSNHFGDEEWTKNFYRHEERQGTEPQQRYAIKHDVYSLGICLLEIGLWESFIVEMDGSFELSDYFLAVAAEHGDYPESKFKDTSPGTAQDDRYKNMNAFCASGKLKGIFIEIARARLPQHMGTDFSELVIGCLGNIEGGFGHGDNFEGEQGALNFERLILKNEG